MRRRLVTGLLAFTALLALVTVLPVYAAPAPEPEPVETAAVQVDLGSVEDPAGDADVQDGTTDPVPGVPDSAPTLTVTRTDVDEFSLVGVTWAADPAVVDVRVQVRVQDADGDWGAWTEVGTEDAEQEPDADVAGDPDTRGGTSPLWTGPSTGVEVELVTRSGAAPTDVQLDLIDPGDSDADTSLGQPDIQDTANAAATMPPVYSRAQWGADENIRTWDPEYATTIKAATLHHTADTNGYTADQVPAMMRSIYRYHTVSRGWGDIGYNVIVDKFGRLWEGRYGGLASTVVGAHAGGFNTGTFGVSMLGSYDTVAVPQATVDSVAAVIAWKFALYNVDPRGSTVLTSGGGGTSRYAAGVQVTLPTVFGHRDVGSTTCPGQYGYGRLPEIRNRVTAAMAGSLQGIPARYASDPAIRAQLGSPVGAARITAGTVWQQYSGGRMYWTPTTGARALWGDILNRYLALGGPEALGAPTSDHLPTPRGDGYYALFENGGIYWTQAHGSKWVKGWVFDRWTALGREQSVLGFPTSEETGVAGGVTQSFQRGVISSSAGTGAHAVWGWVLDKWTALGREGGVLGFPTSDEVATAAGAYNTFAGGAVYSTAQTGAHAVVGWIGQRWIAAGAGSAAVGYPVSDEQRAPDGVGAVSEFSNGLIVSSARTGAHDLVGPIAAKWTALGGVRSFLGYPTADPQPVAGGSVSAFQSGSVYRAPGAAQAFEVHGWIGQKWADAGGPGGALGWPTSDERPAADGAGVLQDYTGGVVYSSVRTGARVVLGPIAAKWTALGGAGAWIGAPVSDQLGMPDRRGAASVFASGAAIYWSPGTGAFEVHGWIRQLYSSLNGEQSFLGYPTSDETPVAGTQAVVGTFQGGRIYSSAATGAREVHGAILDTYLAQGGPAGALGLPTSNEYAVPEGRAGDFEHGRIVCNTTTGTLTVTPR
ncbi:uncharacterized protein with LGFP repeats [Geodermatophilus tzadiensis]|uniref:Uncharacterized protein with LGFP repeats n=1 Tax=Geodermatophilus tzadiensis TaxID=1137988 RepID=A0A2T0U1S1_9ACTN|nr:N-acetylmuramoyl-L-alanine amidase [Geodermatophilus tzadiensis]PRY51872.1 uncharacterized protein with LGFP repeats [Geodermatophilus tzadiensis]